MGQGALHKYGRTPQGIISRRTFASGSAVELVRARLMPESFLLEKK